MRHARGCLRPGDTVEIAIEKPVYQGRGLGRVEGRVVFVPRTFPGDRVRARVSAVHAGWAEAALEQVLEGSPARRPSPCPQGPGCGVCTYQDVAYAEQLRLKEAVLRDALARAGVRWDGSVAVHPSPENAWRTRASLHCVAPGGVLRVGYRQEGTHSVSDLRGCQQLSQAMNAAVGSLREALARRTGLLVAALRGVDLAEAPDGTALLASIAAALRPDEAAALASLSLSSSGLHGIGVECEPHRLVWLRGDAHVHARVLGLQLRAHVRSFFQANRFLYEALAAEVVGLVPPGGGRILDLYAGVGLFALPLAARHAVEVVAVEHAGFSSEDARANARRNGLAVRVVEADVERALAELATAPGERVVLDPPRTGAGPAVVEAVAARRPTAVVYVSCDPPTLARDLARFAARGYRAESVQIFDLFPDTYHLETVVRLTAA